MNISELTAQSILEEEIFCYILDFQDKIERQRIIDELTDKSKLLGVKTKFERMLKLFCQKEKELLKEEKKSGFTQDRENYTNFSMQDTDYENLFCGKWIADDRGIYTIINIGEFPVEKMACYHPILPVMRLENAETGKEKMKIAFRKGLTWREITVEKGILASANKIVGLADYGISVTSETAKSLVSYMSDIENLNMYQIDTKVSTGKLGWINGEFMPYGKEIIFDNEIRFKSAYESIHQEGDREVWYNLVKTIRKGKRLEPKIYIAAALASALLDQLNALPFIVNLWGDTGKGKTVALMLAASIWANPGEGQYITDPKSTITALELRMDFLNSLPMLIDDMAQLKQRYDGDFSEFVYMLCSGKGKDRATSSLGMNKSTSWKNIILTNGEHSMVTDSMQGGAINRIIDIEMGEGYIFPNGNEVVETVKYNYGFCGKEFIDVLNEVGKDKIREIQKEILLELIERANKLGVEKEEKQLLPMSILLTADRLATDYLFDDCQYLDYDICFNLLKNKGEVSENERALEYVIGTITANITKFDYSTEYQGEIWGTYNGTDEYIYIISSRFSKICNDGGFSNRVLLSWLAKNGLIKQDNKGKNTINKKLTGISTRCVALKIRDYIVEEDMENVENVPF